MPSIEVVLGLILIVLFYSLLATIVMELLSNYLALRGKHLEQVLRNMLSSEDGDSSTFKEFLESPMYKQLSGKIYGKTGPPSYLSAQSFQSILMKVIRGKAANEDIQGKINELPNEELKKVLNQLLEDADFKLNDFKDNLERWYDDIMDRASGWYKRNIQKILLIVGLGIAVIFNADTLSIYASLANSSDAELEQLVALAENLSTRESVGTTAKIDREVYELIEANLEDLKDPLSIGWTGVNLAEYTWQNWLFKVFGWLVMALCISKGAPFWFDLLKKAVNIRSSGVVPPVETSPRAVRSRSEAPSESPPPKVSTGKKIVG